MNHIKLLIGALLLTASQTVMGQGAKNIVISEVLTGNTSSIVDEFGQREAWIELENTSFSTYNVRGMFVTTNRKALVENLSVGGDERARHVRHHQQKGSRREPERSGTH